MAEIDSNISPNQRGLFAPNQPQRADRNEQTLAERRREARAEEAPEEETNASVRETESPRGNTPEATGFQARRLAEDQRTREEGPAPEPPPQLERDDPQARIDRAIEVAGAAVEENEEVARVESDAFAGQGILLPVSRENAEGALNARRSRPAPGSESAPQGNTAQLDENAGALRGDNLRTDLATQENRGQRDILAGFNDAIQGRREDTAPPEPAEDGPGGPSVVRENTPANAPLQRAEREDSPNNELTENEAINASSQGVVRNGEEDPGNAPPEPEAVQTERGQNINRLI